MKKLFLASAVILSVMALATASNHDGARSAVLNKQYYQDTVPGKKKDTTKTPKPDSLQQAKLSIN
jgi:hypothetical protein